MHLGPTILGSMVWFALLATNVSTAAIELPSRAGDVHFDHDRHIAYEKGLCTGCHHTSAGAAVRETCRQCHRPSIRVIPDSRSAFHGSCIGCHDRLRRSGQAAGPTKRCSGCHRQAEANGGAAQRP